MPAAGARGPMIPTLGRFPWVCSTPQIPRGLKKRAGGACFPQPHSHHRLPPASAGVSPRPWPLCVQQTKQQHMLSAGSAAVLAVLHGHSLQGRALAPPPRAGWTKPCAVGHPKRGGSPGAEAPRGFSPPPMGAGAECRKRYERQQPLTEVMK